MFFFYMQRGLRDSPICHYSGSPSMPPLQTRPKLDHKCFLCSYRQNKMFLAKCQDRSLPIEIWQLRELRFESDSYLLRADSSNPSGYRARTESCAQCVCGSLLAIYSHKSCHLLRWKGAQCVCFSQSVNSSGFTRRSPHRSFFWLSKITFWVDYTLSTASPNYSSEQRWPANSQRNSAASKRTLLQAWWQSGLRLTAQIASSRNHSMRLITSLFCVLMLKRAKFGNTANSLIFFACRNARLYLWQTSCQVLPHQPASCLFFFFHMHASYLNMSLSLRFKLEDNSMNTEHNSNNGSIRLNRTHIEVLSSLRPNHLSCGT